MKYLKLGALGLWLLFVIWFEDTSDWGVDKLRLAKRSFAVVMVVVVLFSVFFTLKALGQQRWEDGPSFYNLTERVGRIEMRQDRNFEEHAEMKRDIAVIQTVSSSNAVQLDRLIWGVIGLTVATIGQLLLALLKFKVGEDESRRKRQETFQGVGRLGD